MGNLYAHNVISYRKGGVIIDIEKLANKIIEYEANYNWYDLVDDYGNIEIDSVARKNLLEETLRTLQNSPDNIISHLKTIKEDLECDENFENDKEYQVILLY